MIRKIGFALTGCGALLLIWVAVTVWRGDPITSLYTRWEQRGLASRLATVEQRWKPLAIPVSSAVGSSRQAQAAETTRREAIAYRRSLRNGDPFGRIVIPRLGLNMVVIEGTTTADLEKGPGHYNAASGNSTGVPGMGGVIAIAGHRTTFLHPFRHIDDLRTGDRITLVMPYGTFRYTVYAHEVVPSTDWKILRRTSFEKLVLSACHPLYSATHRWIVFARLATRTS